MLNNKINNAKKDIVELVNKEIQLGVPVSVIQLILENVLYEVHGSVQSIMAQELQAQEAHNPNNSE